MCGRALPENYPSKSPPCVPDKTFLLLPSFFHILFPASHPGKSEAWSDHGVPDRIHLGRRDPRHRTPAVPPSTVRTNPTHEACPFRRDARLTDLAPPGSSLSRSGKKILHIDPEEYYGGPDAALTLQDADSWLETRSDAEAPSVFKSASVSKTENEGLSFPRAYALSLSPQVIHARSRLLSQLVSSRAFRQLEFLAVGSFFIYRPSADGAAPSLARIPSTREAVFSNSEIPPKAKRSLMKFLKFVLDYDSEENSPVWTPRADEPLEDFLASEFKLDENLRAYILTLTLSQTGRISVRDGLEVVNRHMTSMGYFGPGFAAVYPKWGGGSEIAQVACRAGAVGGAVYMLGTGVKSVRQEDAEAELEIELSDDVTVKSRALVRGDEAEKPTETVARLVAVVDSPLPSLFEAVVEGSPTPAAAVVAFPKGSLGGEEDPVYVVAHSSDTGECPSGQSKS